MTRSLAISDTGLRLIKAFEGFRPDDRMLVTGIRVVGYGHRLDSDDDPVQMSRTDAEEQLLDDLEPIEVLVNEEVHAPLTQGQYDALVSLAFNIGIDAFRDSDIVRAMNNGRVLDAANGFDVWRKATVNGKTYVIDALMRRRTAEKSLFLRNEPAVPAPSALLVPKQDSFAPNGPTDDGLPRVTLSDMAGIVEDANIINAETVDPAPAAGVLTLTNLTEPKSSYVDLDDEGGEIDIFDNSDLGDVTASLSTLIDTEDKADEESHVEIIAPVAAAAAAFAASRVMVDDEPGAEGDQDEDINEDDEFIDDLDEDADEDDFEETLEDSNNDEESDDDLDLIEGTLTSAASEKDEAIEAQDSDDPSETIASLLTNDQDTESEDEDDDEGKEEDVLTLDTLADETPEEEDASEPILSESEDIRLTDEPGGSVISAAADTLGDRMNALLDTEDPAARDIETAPLSTSLVDSETLTLAGQTEPVSTSEDETNLVSFPKRDVEVDEIVSESPSESPQDDTIKVIDSLAADDVLRSSREPKNPVYDPEGDPVENAMRYLERQAGDKAARKSSHGMWIPIAVGGLLFGASAVMIGRGATQMLSAWGPTAVTAAAITGGLMLLFGLYAVARGRMV